MRKKQSNVPYKANKVLNLILIAIAMIVIRIWYLAEVEYDQRVEEAKKPQQKVVTEPAKRGTIRDRFNLPLAINKINYQAGVVYADICQVPRIKWEIDNNGKKIKRFKRKEYIEELAQLLAKELNLDSKRIVDLIHAKSAFYYQVPFVLKDGISEEEYYRLNMLTKDWPGLHVLRGSKRHYPKGKLGGDVIGYMGAINREEYDGIMQEVNFLRQIVEAYGAGEAVEFPEGFETIFQVTKRLKDLEEHAYSVNDSIGKSGVEAQFEERLRGYHGKKTYYSDARGNFLRELPGGRPPLSGERILLTLSSELQEYAEQLLAKNEQIRKVRVSSGGSNISDPWVKGGAIVALDPNNGEVVAMASFPRFDPNDFQQNSQEIAHWFETESYIASIWDQKRPLEREIFTGNKFEREELNMDWDNYLDRILPVDHPVREGLRKVGNLRNAVLIQRQVSRLLEISGQKNIYRLLNLLYTDDEHVSYGSPLPAHVKASIQENLALNDEEITKIVNSLQRWFGTLKHNYDKVLLVDLCQLAVSSECFDDHLLGYFGHQSLASYRNLNGAIVQLRGIVKEMIQNLFKDLYFAPWREVYGQEYLKEMREIEKRNKSYTKPYIDYFDKKEQELFEEFWDKYQSRFLTVLIKGRNAIRNTTPYDEHLIAWHDELDIGAHFRLSWTDAFHQAASVAKDVPTESFFAYLHTFRNFDELNRPLFGKYRYLRKEGKKQYEKHLAMAFYPLYGFGNARSYAYRQAVAQGSLFKLVTAFAGMMQRHEQLGDAASLNNINPMTIIDQPFKKEKNQYLGSFIGGKAIPQLYKGGRLMKSMVKNIGEVDIVGAIEHSSNVYFSLLAGDYLEDPMQLAYAAEWFSYGKPTGIQLPFEVGGRVPNDLNLDKTALYSTAIGQHKLTVTPLQTAIMLSAIANRGVVFKPNLLYMTAGSKPQRNEEFLLWNPESRYKKSLFALGIDFPLFLKMADNGNIPQVKKWLLEPRTEIEFPRLIQRILFEGMRRVVVRQTTRGIGSLTQAYQKDPQAILAFKELKDQMVGKTSTAETMENLNLDLYRGTNRYNHTWFGCISFDKDIPSEGFLGADFRGRPELVVVVYLRYGSFGKEAAPIAAQIIKKWREIKSKTELLH